MKETVQQILIAGIPVELTRKSCKRINLRVKMNDGRVLLSAPRMVPLAEIESFVLEKRTWILKNLEKAKQNMSQSGTELSPADKRRLREAIRRRISERLPYIESATGLKCNGWTIRDMHTRWGSCNIKTHHINFSLMLAKRSDLELDYVIVHELVHTRVPNHGPEFYAYMDRIMPGWKQIRKGMK